MEPFTITTALTAALTGGLSYVGEKLAEATLSNPAADTILAPLAQQVQDRLPRMRDGADRRLQQVVEQALADAEISLEGDDGLLQLLIGTGQDRLAAAGNDDLRRQVARAILSFIDPDGPPPADVMAVLRWPHSQQQQLTKLLAALRQQLASLPEWAALIAYADRMAEREMLQQLMTAQARWDNLLIHRAEGDALRVQVEQHQMSAEEAATIEADYRDVLIDDLYYHDFRGVVQIRRSVRLPLNAIYQELGLLTLRRDRGRDRDYELQQAELLTLDEFQRLAREEKRLEERVTDALARNQRLVILGQPGAGKTLSLRFTMLMLAQGYGTSRLGLKKHYIPIMARLADYARRLENTPNLALENFLREIIQQEYTTPRLADYLLWALGQGCCMVLLDGLDEVGDNPIQGLSLRTQVVKQVQRFGDRWCNDQRSNRLLVTSRIEGYWDNDLRNAHHVQLSPLRPPDEIETFLLRWMTAHEQAHEPELPLERAAKRAEAKVADLLPRVLGVPSVRRLAMNPLLLTILALIHENVGRLPNRRIKLYEICAQTLIESWRQAQVGMADELLADLGEETIIRIMAPLAYWLHKERPGGTAPFAEWQHQLDVILNEEGFEEHEAEDITHRFLNYARFHAGLLAERGLGQVGFFHLTFEEYLAARQIARQPTEKRRAMLKAHWEDPRWQEVILLAAGQMGIVETRSDDVSSLIFELLCMEPSSSEHAGRQTLLAGRALADIGRRTVNRQTQRLVLKNLQEAMQDVDPECNQPHDPPHISVTTRYENGAVLDELGWLPPDINAWVRCPGCADDGSDLMIMKYPVTNTQFAHFVNGDGYTNPVYWGGEESEGWRWRLSGTHQKYEDRPGPITEPRLWHHTRFGKERHGYPVVGISWYEASAYAAWLTQVVVDIQAGEVVKDGLHALVQSLEAEFSRKDGFSKVRLPSNAEWARIAGGALGQRYAWDPILGLGTRDEEHIFAHTNIEFNLGRTSPTTIYLLGCSVPFSRVPILGPVTRNEEHIFARTNIEFNPDGTSPIAMYPLGCSVPYGLMDISGNVWEWTASQHRDIERARVLRGGSWINSSICVRVENHLRFNLDLSFSDVGCRPVVPIRS